MSRRPTDLRFVLPAPPRRATVLGRLPGWRLALAEAGVQLEAPGRAPAPDLVVAAPRHGRAAARLGADAVLVTGFVPGGELRRHGYRVERFLCRAGPAGPRLVVPLGSADAVGRVARRWARSDSRWRRVRNGAVVRLAAAGVPPGPASTVTLAVRRPGPPPLVAAGAALAAIDGPSWYLDLGGGDELQRAVFHVFAPEGDPAACVVKFTRVPGHDGPFRREEAALTLLHRLAPVAARRAPRLLGRLCLDGIDASAETAATGRPLNQVIAEGRPGEGLRAVEQVAAWVIALGRESTTAADALGPELQRLASEVVAPWIATGAPEDLVASLPLVGGVLAHHDLGSWNVLSDDGGFTAVDWESARWPSLPLWDLLYFLADALVVLHPAEHGSDRLAATTRLFRGEHPASPVLFRLVRAGVRAAEVPEDAVGTVATLCWLHHGLSHRQRGASLGQLAGAPATAELGPLQRLAEPWLSDPLLGPGWDRWR